MPRANAAKQKPRPDAQSVEVAHPDVAPDLAPTVGKNLKKQRAARGLSLEKLAQASGVSRAMLGQIELGQSAPTINVLWKIARALDLPFSALISTDAAPSSQVMRASQAKKLMSHDGAFVSRALFPFDAPRRVEFYELRLEPRTVENADPHPPGTTENLVVNAGEIEIDTPGERHALKTGDAIFFRADAPHTYRNTGRGTAVLYLVMTYAEGVAR